ncbi:MAG: hypothetical protein WCK88_05145 [bacterium]
MPLDCEAQIRYRQVPQECTLTEVQITKDKLQNAGIAGLYNQ